MLRMAGTLLCLIAVEARPARAKGPVSPVVLVPGAGGSQIDVRLSRSAPVPKPWCRPVRVGRWETLWLSFTSLLAPGQLECWAARFRLVVDPVTGKSRPPDGVETRVPGFGGTETIEFLDPHLHSGSAYMKPLVDALVASRRFERGATIVGAPYDHRLSPLGLEEHGYFEQLRTLVEDTAAANDGAPVTLVSHSLGCLVTLSFLKGSDPAWKQKYVNAWVAISGPWGGTVDEMRIVASGDARNVPSADPLVLREEQRTDEISYYLLPSPDVFPAGEELATAPGKQFTARDLPAFLDAVDVGAEGKALFNRVANTTRLRDDDPGVQTHCVHADAEGVSTASLAWGDDGFDRQPKTTYGPGDGTVPRVSLAAGCERAGWSNASTTVRPNGTHSGLLSDTAVAKLILDVAALA